jgi:hypothetical protein
VNELAGTYAAVREAKGSEECEERVCRAQPSVDCEEEETLVVEVVGVGELARSAAAVIAVSSMVVACCLKHGGVVYMRAVDIQNEHSC